MSSQGWILAVFIVYFGAIILMATRFRRAQNLSDYLLGGRKLNAWVGALSAQTSDMSGWLLMGLPGAIYAAGTGRAWIAVGLIIGTVLNWLFVAKRLRRHTIVAKAVTLPEYFENRFRDKHHVLKIIAAVFFAFFFTIYAASGFVAGGTLLPQIFNVNYQAAVIILASFVVIYTLIGGLMAISWTDSIQGMMMLCAVLFLPLIVISTMGGWGNVAAEIPPGFYNIMSDGAGGTIRPISIISDVAWGLGYFGMPHILVKLIAIRSEKDVSKSAVIAIIWVVLALASAVLVGLVGRAFIPGLDNPETVFIQMIHRIFLNQGTVWMTLLGGLFLCGMFAAIKSTADSQLLVGSSAVGDLYRLANKKATDKNLVWFSRLAVFVVAVFALWIALSAYDPALGGPDRSRGVMPLVAMAWAGFGSTFGPLVLCSLFWKRTTKIGAICGMLVGGLTVSAWHFLPILSSADGFVTPAVRTGLFSIVPGFFASLATIFVVSLLTKQPSAEVLSEFDVASRPLAE
ncbi:MAG: sodium/proline symporter [Oscillospiraceae bacterium]|nr:sodium/proline symporter [Oscillospiraceae bacterium]